MLDAILAKPLYCLNCRQPLSGQQLLLIPGGGNLCLCEACQATQTPTVLSGPRAPLSDASSGERPESLPAQQSQAGVECAQGARGAERTRREPRRTTPSVRWTDTPIPDDLTQRHGLFCLYALQQWECLPQPHEGPYKSGYFYHAIPGILRGLQTPSRTTALRHQQTRTCIACQALVDLARSRLDHIIPVAQGGPEHLGNALVLCRRCNSSKGTKDLLAWWSAKQYPASTLPREVLCLYVRVHWQHHEAETLGQPIAAALRAFLLARAAGLPSQEHRIALYGAAYAGCGLIRWLKEPARHG
jgi:5-methylcytosine-specific restriction endonuclease McrA